MLACTDNRDKSSLRKFSGDKVIFMNVHKRYKFPTTVMVEYILSPKVKPSSHDYIGIYPRDWKDLREFVGFEHPIAAPFEEDNLYRIIQFTCQSPHVTASLNQDYQFVYVDQSQQVLGRSNYFQFGDDDWQEGNTPDWWLKKENEWQDDNGTSPPPVENASIQLSPYEIAYNECFFRNPDTINDPNNSHGAADVCAGGLDEASNAYAQQQESSSTHYIPENLSCQRFAQTAYSDHKPRRRRAVVKTTHVYPNAHRDVPSTSFNKPKDQASNTSVDLAYSQNWLQPKQHVPLHNRAFSGRGDTNSGAIPKKCPKCHAPSDYNNKQQLMQHELSQAYEQIRDLRTELDQLRKNFELSVTAHAKIRATAELAKLSGDKNFFLLRNLIQTSLISQYGEKVANCSGPVAMVPSEQSPSGWGSIRQWGVSGGPGVQSCRPVNFGRAPSEERRLRGREKELKAYIGCQEKTIQSLVEQLVEARKSIEDAKSAKCSDLNPEPSGHEPAGDISFPQQNNGSFNDSGTLEHVSSVTAKVLPNEDASEPCSASLGSHFSKVSASDDAYMNTAKLLDPSIVPTQQAWKDLLIVEPKFYHVDEQSLGCKVIVNEDQNSMGSGKGAADSLREANNNNFETKNLNPIDHGKNLEHTDDEAASTDVDSVSCQHR